MAVLDWRVAPGVLLLLSVAFIIVAIVGPLSVGDAINKKLEEKFLFTGPEGIGYERWSSNEAEGAALSYVYVYVYNTTNPVEANAGARPHVVEVGPYVYRQYLRNVNPEFSFIEEERVVTSTPYIYLVWAEGHPDNGARTQQDLITAPSFGLWTINSVVPDLMPVVLSLFAKPMNITAFTTLPVYSWLFGFTDPLLAAVGQQSTVQYIRNQTSPEDAFNQVKTSTVSCGFPNTKRFQQLLLWQNSSTIKFWTNTNQSVPVVGSPGNYFGFFRRGAGQTEEHFWNTVGRTLEMEVKIVTTYKGVEVYRYKFLDREVYNSTEYPPNAVYNQFGPRGLFNATAILTAPIFYSWPYFYGGDPWLGSQLDGLRAPTEDDESYVDVQPVIGANCHSSRKLQGNLKFGNLVDTNPEPNTGINISGPLYYYPSFWIDIKSEITDDQAQEMVDSLRFYNRALVAEDVMLYGGGVCAAISFCLSVWIFYQRRDYWRKGGREGHLMGNGAADDDGDNVPLYDSRETYGGDSSS